MPTPNSIDLIELPATDAATLETTRDFYAGVFGWSFTSYGPEYVDTSDSSVAFGINSIDEKRQAAPLPVLYVSDLVAVRDAIAASGGRILHDIYDFPGGRRFHFVDPAGNELAAWSEA
jgi:uncharacterized protein